MTDEQKQQYETAVLSLAKEINDLKHKLERDKERLKELQDDYDRLETNHSDTCDAMKELLAPLMKENKVHYLIHPNPVVRGAAIEIIHQKKYEDE